MAIKKEMAVDYARLWCRWPARQRPGLIDFRAGKADFFLFNRKAAGRCWLNDGRLGVCPSRRGFVLARVFAKVGKGGQFQTAGRLVKKTGGGGL
jgi:hypothetical protein